MANKYTPKIKQEILDFASNHSLSETSKKYGCNILSIHRWRKETMQNEKRASRDYECEINDLKHKIDHLQNTNKELGNRISDLLNLNDHLQKVHKENQKEWKEATEQAVRKLSEESWETNKFCSILIARIAKLMEKN